MTKAEILASLKDQAKDKDILANGEKDSIFTRDAQALREAAEMLKKSEVVRHDRWGEQKGYDGDVFWDCPACGESWSLIKGIPIDKVTWFCPNCGAKMDGGKDDAQE